MYQEMQDKNLKHIEEFIKGEEGIDYVLRPKTENDPFTPNAKILEKELRQ